MVKQLTADYLRRLGADLFVACGTPPADAEAVAGELVEANLMGIDSHGVMRYMQYVDDVLKGQVRPGAPVRIVKETATTALVDCGFNFGPVTAARMVEIVCRKAEEANLACAVSLNSNHVGRLGAYAQKIAARGLFGLATVNSSKHGHWVVPWGGREGRLATNPLAFAAPTGGDPVLLDMSTSMMPEGKIRNYLHQGKQLPPGCIQDAAGNPATDPALFYGPPHGTIRPLGSELGFRGFGLSLLVEILGGILAGEASSQDSSYTNGLCLLALNPAAFCGRERFQELMDDLVAYVTGTPPAPGYAEVMMPGTPEFRTRAKRLQEGIPVPDETWRQIVETAKRVGVEVEEA